MAGFVWGITAWGDGAYGLPAYVPSGGGRRRGPRFRRPDEPLDHIRTVAESIASLYGDATAMVTEYDDWVVLDMPELVLQGER